MTRGLSPSQDEGTAQETSSPRQVGLPRLLTFLLPATVGMYAVYQAIQQILLPAQLDAIDSANKIQNLALLTTLSSIAAVVALPAGGAISDRTRGRFGRRTPWLILAGVASALLTAVMGTAANIVVLASVYTVLWFTMNYYQAVITAILPDRVSENRRGTASAVLGLAIPLGVLVGVNLVAHLSSTMGYVVIAAIFIATAIALVVGAPEGAFHGHAPAADAPPAEPKSRNPIHVVGRFFGSFRSFDFTIVFVSRLLLFLAYFVSSGYLYYIVQDEIGAANVPGGDIAVGVSILTTVNTVSWVVVVPVIGWLADKLDRRKLVVGLCGVLMGVSLLIPVLWTSYTGLVVYSIFTGAFFGAYMALDIAIMSLVLPDRENEGRDMAVLAVGTSGPQVVAPMIAGGLILAFDGYDAVFLFAAVTAVLGGLVLMLVRSLR
ncbi:MFS transporter [Pseudonocardia sp. RS11V-5]|uniref:MFS transporter n=1 Tax=Pseudonocardia terrae TaxID=2905831 RepID=UPI001E38BF49|nr:MFS transporter [Pseudonocardia terrae]MCE3555818.1 MFS transporter [Pseudonocardia terrae]